MKNLRYKGPADTRSFSAEDFESVEIDESEGLVWDQRTGGVLEVKNATADKLIELYPNDFEVIGDEEAEQLETEAQENPGPLTVASDPNPDESTTTTATGAGAGATRTRSSTRKT